MRFLPLILILALSWSLARAGPGPANIGRRLAIVLNGVVLTAPVLQARITDGAQISGFDSLEDANRIAALMRHNALPFEIDSVDLVNR